MDELDELGARGDRLLAESARLRREIDAEPWYLRRWPYLSGRSWRRRMRGEEVARALAEQIAAIDAAIDAALSRRDGN